jgi:DNA-binding NarL/FixJ family response regulator
MIAKTLNMSPKTVESHRARIKEKLQTKTISELIAHAAGWVARQSIPPSTQGRAASVARRQQSVT